MKKKFLACAMAGAVALSTTSVAAADDDTTAALGRMAWNYENSDRKLNQGSVDFDNKVGLSVLSADSVKDVDEAEGYLLGFLLVWVAPLVTLGSLINLSHNFQVQQGLIRPLSAE